MFRMFDAFIPGSSYKFGELEEKIKASTPRLATKTNKLAAALVVQAAVVVGDTKSMAKAGKLVVELYSIVVSLMKAIGYLHTYKKPRLI